MSNLIAIYSAVIDKAFELTGNSTPQTRAPAWQPSATIKYNSGVSGEAIMPLENVLVRANTFFNTGQSYTDASGNVTIKKGWGGKFRKATKYIIIWSKDGQWKIHDKAGKAKHKGPTQKSHWNFTISGDGTNHDAVCATIHRALNIYYNKTYPQLAGLAKYNNIDVKEHHNEYSTPQLGYVNGSFDSSVLTNEIHIWGKTYKPRTPVQMLATTFHELGHASHNTYLRSVMSYKNAGDTLRESWANGIRYAYMSALYPDSYSSIVDDFAYTDEYTAVIESLIWQGASIQQLQSCLFGCNSFADFRTHVKAVSQVPDVLVDYIFANPMTPIRINLGTPISGPDTATVNTTLTYSIPSTLPTGITFTGWTISPSPYTTSGGTTNRSLNITFTEKTEYSINAHFVLSTGAPYVVTRKVCLTPLSPPANFTVTGPTGKPKANSTQLFQTDFLSSDVVTVAWDISPRTGVSNITPVANGYKCTIGFSNAAANLNFTVTATARKVGGQASTMAQYSFTMGSAGIGTIPPPISIDSIDDPAAM